VLRSHQTDRQLGMQAGHRVGHQRVRGWGQSRNALVRQDNRGDLESRPSPAADISLRVGLNRPGHHDVDNLVRHFRDRLGRGGNGFQPAIARTQTLAFSLSFNPGKCRRSSTIADSSPLSSNAFRMAAAVDSSTLNMPNSIRDRARPAKSRLTVSGSVERCAAGSGFAHGRENDRQAHQTTSGAPVLG
jgi:hypothetical protein